MSTKAPSRHAKVQSGHDKAFVHCGTGEPWSKLRPSTVPLACRLLAPLLDSGLVMPGELSVIRKNLLALAKTGELAPAVFPKLIPGQEAAEMLAVSYSQFRALEKEGVFPFRRRLIGGKTVRYLNTEIIDYMQVGSLKCESTDGGDDEGKQ